MMSVDRAFLKPEHLEQRSLQSLIHLIVDENHDAFKSTFSLSLALKDALDKTDFQTHRTEYEDMQMLAYEFALYTLNGSGELRHHPFLSHWAEVIRRMQSHAMPTRRPSGPSQQSDGVKARISLIQTILRSDEDPVALRTTMQKIPRQLLAEARDVRIMAIDLRPYITMLREEGIYSATEGETILDLPPQGPPTEMTNSTPNPRSTDRRTSNRESHDHDPLAVPAIKDLLSLIYADPSTARDIIVHLPITLPSLELINTLIPMLKESTKPSPLDPIELARDFIQHGLRTAETPNTSTSTSANIDPNTSFPGLTSQSHTSSHSSTTTEEWQIVDHESSPFFPSTLSSDPPPSQPPDRSERIRIIRLTVLFLRSLIRGGVAGPEQFLFEIRELSVRFGWVGEVRGFLGWLEGVDLVDDVGDDGGGGEFGGMEERDRGKRRGLGG